MLEFREMTLADKEWADPLIALSGWGSAEYNFTVIYIWKDVYGTRICRYRNFLLVRSRPIRPGEDHFQYLFPAGSGTEEDLVEAIRLCKEDALANGGRFAMAAVTPGQKSILENLFPHRFTFTPVRDSFDYIYSAEDLLFLRGRKFQSKRNFISRFRKLEHWQYEAIAPGNLDECRRMNDLWCARYGCHQDASLGQESCSVKTALENFTVLGLEGGLLRLNGEVVAFTIGERLNSETYLVHIEKAFAHIPGAYPAMANEFLQHILLHNGVPDPEIRYINREDDAGDSGLREAKMQYHPVFLLEKYAVEEK